jgi:hypothetical protein
MVSAVAVAGAAACSADWRADERFVDGGMALNGVFRYG